MIERLYNTTNMDKYGNIYGTYNPTTRQIVDKINELVDKINELDAKVNKLSDILKYSDNENAEINNNEVDIVFKKSDKNFEKMNNTNKYNVGDVVWFKGKNDKCYCATITEIHFRKEEGISYSFFRFNDRLEKDVFPTEEELLNSIQ